MVQGSDDNEDWEKVCAQEGLELVLKSDSESESGREGWISDSKNEGSEGSDVEGEASVSDSKNECSDSEKDGTEGSLGENVGEGLESESESGSDDKPSDTSKYASTDSDSENENENKMTLKSVRVGNKITFECHKCNFKCGSSGRVYSHMYKEHNMKKFECKHCDFSTPNKTSLLNHVHCYYQKNGWKKKKKLVTTKVTVKVDKQIKLPKCLLERGEPTFICQYCKDFKGRSSGVVFTHMCDVHGLKPFSCKNCDFTSKNKTLMYNHETHYCPKLGNK